MQRSGSKRSCNHVIALAVTAMLASCDRERTVSPHAESNTPSPLLTAVTDEAMGPHSALAQLIALALQDSAARFGLATALRTDSTARTGIDLQDCATSPVVVALLKAAERRGGATAAAACETMSRQRGLVLYMDPDRVAQWDGRESPIVTAIADPQLALPRTFLGYRGPNQTIQLPSDGSLRGPILVVLPYRNSARAARLPKVLPPSRAIQAPGLTQSHTPSGAFLAP